MQTRSPFKMLLLVILAGLPGIHIQGHAAQATESAPETESDDAPVDLVIKGQGRRQDMHYGEIVSRVFAPQVHDWQVLDQQRLILYASRSKPYLVTLRRRARGLDKNTVIGLQRRGSSIDARFDQIYVDGIPYPFERIEKISIETARRLRGLEPIPESDSDQTPEDSNDSPN